MYTFGGVWICINVDFNAFLIYIYLTFYMTFGIFDNTFLLKILFVLHGSIFSSPSLFLWKIILNVSIPQSFILDNLSHSIHSSRMTV